MDRTYVGLVVTSILFLTYIGYTLCKRANPQGDYIVNVNGVQVPLTVKKYTDISLEITYQGNTSHYVRIDLDKYDEYNDATGWLTCRTIWKDVGSDNHFIWMGVLQGYRLQLKGQDDFISVSPA